MKTNPQFFRQDHPLVACALGEPSLTLVQNDSAFGLLLASGAHEDLPASRFYLDSVTYLYVEGDHWHYSDFVSVAVYADNGGFWLAQDVASGRYFPKPSYLPYHVLFISAVEFRRLQHWRGEGIAFPIFEFAQQRFGRLPGFSFREKNLETPAQYATAERVVPVESYVAVKKAEQKE